MSADINDSHEYNPNWRWPSAFESFVESELPDDETVLNVCAGLCPVGDVRVDVHSPAEIVAQMQADDRTSLADARRVLSDLLPEKFTGEDIVAELYTADDPTDHKWAEALNSDGLVLADGFDRLPFPDNTFPVTVSDPPWLDMDDSGDGERARLIEELCRVTKPGGQIYLNSTWVPSGQHPVILTDVVPRQDTANANPGFTPKVSWLSVYQVVEAVEIAHHHSRVPTSSQPEYIPRPESVGEAIRAEWAVELCQDGVDLDEISLDAVTSPEKCCTQCGGTAFNPVNTATDGDGFDDLYECVDCRFRAPEAELATQ